MRESGCYAPLFTRHSSLVLYSSRMENPDQLRELFRMQKSLNERIGVKTDGMSEEEKTKWLLNYTRAMQQEMAELTDSVPWKWWAKYQKFDEQNARVEVMDLFHFLISMAQVLGMSADDDLRHADEKMKQVHDASSRHERGRCVRSLRQKERGEFQTSGQRLHEEGRERFQTHLTKSGWQKTFPVSARHCSRRRPRRKSSTPTPRISIWITTRNFATTFTRLKFSLNSNSSAAWKNVLPAPPFWRR